jgi:hypothetical protein
MIEGARRFPVPVRLSLIPPERQTMMMMMMTMTVMYD